ncbi:hypothetical protein RRF57_000824 [Xylaria bambusicola]|uniref:Uncharacterized protein n=1 Tax=Xylaria bambusicola TaxID=326684 RepID=A0AAN7UAU9_9PEZI
MPVTGVGGAAEAEAADERVTLLFGRVSGVVEEDTVASAAFRFLVMGGMVSLGGGNVETLASCEPQKAVRGRTRARGRV